MKYERLLWEVFLHDIEILFQRFNIESNLSKQLFKNEPIAPYLEQINQVEEQWHLPIEIYSGDIHKKLDKNIQLISIISRVNVTSNQSTGKYFLPLLPLSVSEEMFPQKEENLGLENIDEKAKTLLQEFLKEINDYLLDNESPDFETFYYLAQKYLWCIGIQKGNHDNEKGVSLFEHLKSLAALMMVFQSSFLNGTQIHEEPLALVGFDISGIQEFIYTISTKGAAKSLKGRSFYLQLLELGVSRYLLDSFSLPVTNLIYSGGGKGFILAPTNMISKLDAIEKEINSFLFNEMGTKISMGFAAVSFSADQLSHFSVLLDNMMKKLATAKKQKFAFLLSEKYYELFNPPVMDMSTLANCTICGKIGKTEPDEDGNQWCGVCLKFKEIGTQLRNALAISERRNSDLEPPLTFHNILDAYEFLSEKDLKEYTPGNRFIYYLNDTTLFSQAMQKKWRAGFWFIAGNKTPLKNGGEEPANINDIANASKGTKKLGVVRGDVDNLGHIFSQGLGKSISLEQLAQLSFFMKHFFCSMINLYFTAEKSEFIVYSGGDDFFIVGPWSHLIDDLVTFRKKFAQYTAFNPAFSFSASFSVFGSHYPAFKFADVAGTMEQKAKENQVENLKKNSICFMGKVVFWEDFFKLQELTQYLENLVNKDKISKSYIQLLQKISQYHLESEKKGKTPLEINQAARFHRWKWYYAWQAARLLERDKNEKEIVDLLETMEKLLFQSAFNDAKFINRDSLYLLEIPARWAELKTRSERR